MTLYHPTPATARALAIMLWGFHDGRDGATMPFRRGIYFEVEPKQTTGYHGIVLDVEDERPLQRFAVSLFPANRVGSRGYFYLLPADVANCYEPRMIGDVASRDQFAND
jgi:hypothetical protein